MTLSEEQVEWIVFEVLRRLGVTGNEHRVAGDERSSSPVDRVAGDERSSSPDANGSDLRIAERVITMRSIDARLTGVKRIVVQPRAVITSAVKDELKARKVELVFER